MMLRIFLLMVLFKSTRLKYKGSYVIGALSHLFGYNISRCMNHGITLVVYRPLSLVIIYGFFNTSIIFYLIIMTTSRMICLVIYSILPGLSPLPYFFLYIAFVCIFLELGSTGNNLSTSDIVVRSAYTLPSPDLIFVRLH